MSFSCAPASRVTHSKEGHICTTYAVLETGPDVKPDSKGKTVAVWEEHITGGMSSNLGEDRKKRSAVVRR